MTRILFHFSCLILVIVLLGGYQILAQSCHSSIGLKALDYLSSKRPYHFDSSGPKHVYSPGGCAPVKLWYFGRHGTRYPGGDDIEDMKTVLPQLHQEILEKNESSLCPEALAYFSSWRPRKGLDVSKESRLHMQGKWELGSIASRFVSRFPDLFPISFDNGTYYFKFTDSQRTKASAKSFAASIFGKDNLSTVWFPKPLKKDPVLKFYSACPKWDEEVDKNPVANKQHDMFVVSRVMNETIGRVSQRLGIERNLTLDEITIMYTTCAFETAWKNGSISKWCVLFGEEDFRVLAFREDLEYYWKDGYGYPINYLQACTPFVDALAFFDEYRQGGNYRKVQAYFSHSGANLKMFARLGLFNSGEIRSDNYDQVKDTYEFRTSRIDFMGSNMAFVLYTCDGGSRLKIGLLMQEIPTAFPGCGGEAFCDYSVFRKNLVGFTADCNLSQICSV